MPSAIDPLTVFLDATRYNMMILLTEGEDVVLDSFTSYSYGDVELRIEAIHPEMTTGNLAWMIEGWLDLVRLYGWWEEKVELRDDRLGMLAVGTIGR